MWTHGDAVVDWFSALLSQQKQFSNYSTLCVWEMSNFMSYTHCYKGNNCMYDVLVCMQFGVLAVAEHPNF